MMAATALLRALADAEALAARGAPATWAAWKASATHGVDAAALKDAWLDKLLGTMRARAAVASMNAGDAAVEADRAAKRSLRREWK